MSAVWVQLSAHEFKSTLTKVLFLPSCFGCLAIGVWNIEVYIAFCEAGGVAWNFLPEDP